MSDKVHQDFFADAFHETGTASPPNVAAINLLSVIPETRTHFWNMVDLDGNFVDDCRNCWQDLDSCRCVALAANLGCNGGSYPELSPVYPLVVRWLRGSGLLLIIDLVIGNRLRKNRQHFCADGSLN